MMVMHKEQVICYINNGHVPVFCFSFFSFYMNIWEFSYFHALSSVESEYGTVLESCCYGTRLNVIDMICGRKICDVQS